MKKLHLLILSLVCFTILATSCSSNKSSDFAVSEDSSPTLNGKKTVKAPAQKKQFVLFKYGNVGDYIQVDNSSVFTPNVLGALKQKKATVVIYPKQELAGFGSPYLAAYYYLFMNETSRNNLRKAVDNYFSDFENKRLLRDGKNTDKIYGKTDVNLRWGTLSNSTPNNGDAVMNLGYVFKKGSPYFSITIYPTFNKYSEVTSAVDRESMMLTYYFTKAQISEILSMLDEDMITEQFNIYKNDNVFTNEDVDSYDDSDDYSSEEYTEAVVEE